MTYMSVLVKCLLRQASPSDLYVLKSGSWHGFDDQLPIKFLDYKIRSPRTIGLWKEFYDLNLNDAPTVFRDEWRDNITEILEEGINETRSIVILNTVNSRIEKYYRWLNAADRIPLHLFRNMRNASMYYPKLWQILPKHVKRRELEINIDFDIAKNKPRFSVPVFETSLIDLLSEDYCYEVHRFLADQELENTLTDDIRAMHQIFLRTNALNIELSRKLLVQDFWKPRHLLDEILFEGIAHHGF